MPRRPQGQDEDYGSRPVERNDILTRAYLRVCAQSGSVGVPRFSLHHAQLRGDRARELVDPT